MADSYTDGLLRGWERWCFRRDGDRSGKDSVLSGKGDGSGKE